MKRMNPTFRSALLTLLLLIAIAPCLADNSLRIQPNPENPHYWLYQGKPVVLLGGTDDDNLFQWPDLKPHLELLASCGGNYIRNTMSDRQDKGFELYPFKKLDNGKYDLDQWDEAYWQRFAHMLQWTEELGIIVQIEVFDRFDYAQKNWDIHPYNPKNNITYTYEETGFEEQYPDHPGSDKQVFFHSVPGMKRYQPKFDTFRIYQERFVDKLLSLSLPHGNVLYCMDNETNTPAAWGQFWIAFIQSKAKEAGVNVYCTDMFDAWDIKSEEHHPLYNHPEIYTFVDISQNNHNKGQVHWDNIQWARESTAQAIRPINTVKIYGADTGRFGNTRDGQERFWRNIFGGLAGTRFHRPDSGLGLSDLAQVNLRSMRALLFCMDIFTCQPDAKSHLLSEREDNEAYLTYCEGQQYALYFPNGGQVKLDLSAAPGEWNLVWLDIQKSTLSDPESIQGGKAVEIKTPEPNGYWAAVLTR